VEELLLQHAKGIASLDERAKNLGKDLSELMTASSKRFDELRHSIEDHKTESADLKLRLAIAEKDIADLKVLLERGRVFRWGLAATLISVLVSSFLSAVISYYMKPK
jgi:hypothetical protein